MIPNCTPDCPSSSPGTTFFSSAAGFLTCLTTGAGLFLSKKFFLSILSAEMKRGLRSRDYDIRFGTFYDEFNLFSSGTFGFVLGNDLLELFGGEGEGFGGI